jgi:hypothetical protein
MRNEIKTQSLNLTLLLKDTLAVELVSGDPATMWSGIQYRQASLDGDYRTVYLISVKGRARFGNPYTYDALKVEEWDLQASEGSRRVVAGADLASVLSPGQLKIVVDWLVGRNAAAWARASEELRTALGKPEPFYSVAEASRRANIPVTTLDSAVRSTPQRVPAAQDQRGLFRVRMSALKKALGSGRVRSGVIKRRRKKAKRG